jgi:hypothetical protein
MQKYAAVPVGELFTQARECYAGTPNVHLLDAALNLPAISDASCWLRWYAEVLVVSDQLLQRAPCIT